MPKDPSILQIEITNFLSENNVIIRKGSIDAIQEAYEKKLEVAEIVAISYEETDEDFVLSLSKEKWNEYLNATLDSLSAQDEFELCIEIQNLIKEINS